MLLNPVKTGVCPLGIRPRCVFSKMSSFLCASHPTDNNPWKYKRYSRSSRNCKVAKHNCNICQCCTTLPKRPTSFNIFQPWQIFSNIHSCSLLHVSTSPIIRFGSMPGHNCSNTFQLIWTAGGSCDSRCILACLRDGCDAHFVLHAMHQRPGIGG